MGGVARAKAKGALGMTARVVRLFHRSGAPNGSRSRFEQNECRDWALSTVHAHHPPGSARDSSQPVVRYPAALIREPTSRLMTGTHVDGMTSQGVKRITSNAGYSRTVPRMPTARVPAGLVLPGLHGCQRTEGLALVRAYDPCRSAPPRGGRSWAIRVDARMRFPPFSRGSPHGGELATGGHVPPRRCTRPWPRLRPEASAVNRSRLPERPEISFGLPTKARTDLGQSRCPIV